MKYLLGLNSEELEKDDWTLSKFDGVGMIRGENLCIKKLQYFTIKEFRDYVTDYLNKIAIQFQGKEVWYRTADLVPHQINVFEGADAKFEEPQYIMGTRGIRRNLIYQEAYLQELNCFVNASKNNSNLGILIPFVSRVEEMKIVMELLRKKFKFDGKIGMMLETPASVLMLDEFNKLGIDNYTLGLNDLTTFTLGVVRENKEIYSMNDPAVKKVINYVTNKVHSFDKPIIVAGYLDKEIVLYCEEIGVDYCNIHYDLIPEIFDDIVNPEKFKLQYKTIKERYNVQKQKMKEKKYDSERQ